MTYSLIDASVSSGSPAELYRFVYFDQKYRYCTLDGGVGPFDYKIAGATETFTPTSIRRGAIEVTEEMSRNTLEITMPISSAVPQLFLSAPPDGVVSVTVYRFHLTDTADEYITEFKGRVIATTFQDDEATLICEPIFTSLRRPGLRKYYAPQCVHELYGNGCNLLRDDWEVASSVIGESGNVLTVSAIASYANDWFTGGVFRCGTVRRLIVDSNATTITLLNGAGKSLMGQACILLPGCSHLRSDCHNKFNNVPNYLGFDWMPLRSPYGSDNVFF